LVCYNPNNLFKSFESAYKRKGNQEKRGGEESKKKEWKRKKLWLRCKKSNVIGFQSFRLGLALMGLKIKRKKSNNTNLPLWKISSLEGILLNFEGRVHEACWIQNHFVYSVVQCFFLHWCVRYEKVGVQPWISFNV